MPLSTEGLLADTILGYGIHIDSDHAKIHDGKGFVHTGKHSISAGASYDHLLVNPASNFAHFRFMVTATNTPVDVLLYESPTTTDNGTAADVYNNNFNSSHTPNLAIYEGPTVSAVGTLKYSKVIPSTSVGAGTGGASDSLGKEFILKADTNYLIRITNNASGSADVNAEIFFYE